MSGAIDRRLHAPEAPLPGALSELTDRVVRKTRLWASERRDLHAELESHFREGLIELAQEGHGFEDSVDILRDGFGDPILAARLIRRGKKRGRPMFWKVLMSALSVSIIALAAGGGYAAYLALGAPTPSVDYVAKINEPVQAIPESERAWPLLRDILLEFRPSAEVGPNVEARMPGPGDAEWPDAVQWVASNRHLVPRIVEAAARPTHGFVYSNPESIEWLRSLHRVRGKSEEEIAAMGLGAPEDPLVPPTVVIVLPQLSELRSLGRFLVLDARERLSQGDFYAAWESLDAAHRLGAQLFGSPTLIEQLVGRALLDLSTADMRRALYTVRDTLTPDQMRIVNRGHVMTIPLDTIKPSFEGEKLFFEDIVQYLFTDDGAGNGRLIPGQLAKIAWVLADGGAPDSPASDEFSGEAALFATAAVHADRRETVEKYYEVWDRMQELLALPLYDARRADAGRIIDSELGSEVGARRFALIRKVIPNLTWADEAIRTARMDQIATRAIVAMLQFRAVNGRWPDRLAELVPDRLWEVPKDSYSGLNLRYVVRADGTPVLYSVGRNLIDEVGSTAAIPAQHPGDRESTADIVYWPAR